MTRVGRGENTKETARISAVELAELQQVEPQRRGVALLVYHRDGVSSVPIREGVPVVIGRNAPDWSGLTIEDPSLSREHARFSLSGDTVSVVDLDSRNGTWLRGARVQHAELAIGDEVRLSAVPVVVQDGAALQGLLRPLSHERFRLALEDEVVRARHFRRPFALIMARAEGVAPAHVSSFHRHVAERLRPVDRVAFYSPDVLEILLSEASAEHAMRVAEDVIASPRGGAQRLLAGVAMYPDAASDAETLLAACRKAVLAAGPAERVRGATGAPAGAAARVEAGAVITSPALRAVFDKLGPLARSKISVLILGESGVGKEVLAQYIHDQSPRRGKPLVVVNCAAIPETLVESILFGHQRGAFTGAAQQQKGLFEAADGGTLMLDEIGDLPKPSQAALLRVLESGRVRRIGAADEISVDVRIVAATHRDLELMKAQDGFRDDLLYRLSGEVVTLPPLRERVEEIEPLCVYFIKAANEANGRAVAGVDPRAMVLLKAYSWPGNIRELRNAIDRAVVLTQASSITPEDLPERVQATAPAAPATERPAPRVSSAPPPPPPPSVEGALEAAGGDLKECIARYEAAIIVAALNASGGNQKAAAKRLGLPLRTLVHKRTSLGIQRVGYQAAESQGPKRAKKG